jgi:hypothetical protein
MTAFTYGVLMGVLIGIAGTVAGIHTIPLLIISAVIVGAINVFFDPEGRKTNGS